MIKIRTCIGVSLFFSGIFTLILIPVLKLPIFIVYICLVLIITGPVVREGNPSIMLRIGIIISILLIISIWITLVVTLSMILLFRPYVPPETSAEEFALNILIIITVIEGIIFMFLYVIRCLRWDNSNT